jgi:hypothetical protein
MIVVDTENNVKGSGPLITKIDVPGEGGLIKVVVDDTIENGFFYIGTLDRDLWKIYEDTSVPDIEKEYKFYVLEDGTYEYVEIN